MVCASCLAHLKGQETQCAMRSISLGLDGASVMRGYVEVVQSNNNYALNRTTSIK